MAALCCWCHQTLGRWKPSPGVTERPYICREKACKERVLKHSVILKEKGNTFRPLFVPLPKQAEWSETALMPQVTRLLVGGAAGPGKSRWLRESLYKFAQIVPGFHGLLLRRTYKDLDQSHLRFVPFEVQQRGGNWKASDKIIEFFHAGKPTSIIRMGHLEDAGALKDYLSSEYDMIAPDELVTFNKDEMLELFSRARSVNPDLYNLRGGYKYWDYNEDGVLEEMETDGSLVLTATNPGGRGARWIKDFFIDQTPDPDEHPHYKPEFWAFHGARLKDNPYIKRSYVTTLKDMSETRRRQLLDGDWDVFDGQFFDWKKTLHVQDLGLVA